MTRLSSTKSRLSDAALGHAPRHRKSLFEALAQLWRNHRWREVRDPATYAPDPTIGRRGRMHGDRVDPDRHTGALRCGDDG